METPKETLGFTTLDTEKSFTIRENGVMIGYTLVLPQTSAANAILTIKDDDGYTVYTGDAKNDNQTVTVMGLDIPIVKGSTATVTLNTGAGGAYDVVVKIYVKKQ